MTIAELSQSDGREICFLQLASLTTCARSLSEPENETLSLDGLSDAIDKAIEPRASIQDSRVEQLRLQLLDGLEVFANTFQGDTEASLVLSDFMKACTATNTATPLSLDPLALCQVLSRLMEDDLNAVWFSIAGLLLFRLGKRILDISEQGILQAVLGRGLRAGIDGLQKPGGEWYGSDCQMES